MMTIEELRRRVREEHLDGQTVLCGNNQFSKWTSEMPCIERFCDPVVANLGFPTLYSTLEHPRVHIVLHPDLHPDESRVVKEWDGK